MLRIVALIKFTPESAADRHLDADFILDRADTPGRLSELDEYAVEQSLQLAEKLEAEVPTAPTARRSPTS